MASYTAARAKTITTTNAAMDDTTLSDYGAIVQVANHSTAGVPIYCIIGQTAATTTTPTSQGDDAFVVLPGQVASFPYPIASPGNSVCVKTIAAAAQLCTIQVLAARAF